ncbi:integrase core domain-containing protein [Neolewinella litorea]|uniref:Integrase catalytic domain-containing protein n=1 Tax=Neolewinella litorea TaxID=2562452 RepID=A0A4S4N977_9BACT|nr:hypothetical protein E4021_17570 [Neolewinella litorea]
MEALNEQIQDWSVVYNYDRPHKSLGNQTPEAYKKANENFYFRVVAA